MPRSVASGAPWRAAVLVAAIIGASLYFVAYQNDLGNRASSAPESTNSPSSSGLTATGVSSSDASDSTSVGTTETTTGGWIILPCNCTLDLNEDWQTYSTMQDLASHSTAVIVGTVTSEEVIGANDSFLWGRNVGLVPVTDYNVTVTTLLFDRGDHFGVDIEPGYWTIIAQVGGTFGHTTTNVTGYPTLAVGTSYVFFLANKIPIEGHVYNGLATTGGSQGLFYIQGDSVFSLDNMYPQADSWLPVKANGVPLAVFVQEIQAAVSSTTSSAAPNP